MIKGSVVVVDDGVLCLNVGCYREGCDVDRHVLDRSSANKNNSITTFCSEFSAFLKPFSMF